LFVPLAFFILPCDDCDVLVSFGDEQHKSASGILFLELTRDVPKAILTLGNPL